MNSMQTELFAKSSFEIEAKHTTHSGGKGEYLHDWYSYLEGFSSSFVYEILKTYAPDAEIVLEPFAGVGTTPVNSSILGCTSYYCEINPVLRKVVAIKKKILGLLDSEKSKFLLDISILCENLSSYLQNVEPSEELRKKYYDCFDKSIFFSQDTFEQVLKFRSLVDQIALNDELLAEALEVAILSCLVTCSLLKRSGDVRFKTPKELSKGVPLLLPSVLKQLNLMMDDCRNCPRALAPINLLANNSKEVLDIKSIQADIVITSPPYLNGTNYFRNTKLELWFIGELLNNKSLRVFRDQVVTSGINDVTKDKGKDILPLVSDLYAELLEKAYDARIAKMMSAYFYEMKIVLEGLHHHTKPNGVVCIDIGDSVYANVYIPTHTILTEIAKDLGFSLYEEIVLRKRYSNGGAELGQYLLVFKKMDSDEK